ncbi:hypothetical protein KQX54_018945 [Cotesia glomerata]|uniref:Uncharacterized protein n=1 Tax=Cotesia glomerata TaxID=32391 RepID=A0AAV7HZ52_COTGL|nr:hypothetical protein KQX54_018945 [Cotesia glomerata]
MLDIYSLGEQRRVGGLSIETAYVESQDQSLYLADRVNRNSYCDCRTSLAVPVSPGPTRIRFAKDTPGSSSRGTGPRRRRATMFSIIYCVTPEKDIANLGQELPLRRGEERREERVHSSYTNVLLVASF